MESILQEINAVIGVNGSLACATDGKILAQAMPEPFDRARLDMLARVATQTFNALELSRQHVTDVDLVFDQHRLVLKNLRGGVLVILCARNINLPLLNMTANNAVKKISAGLAKPAAIPAQPTQAPLPPPPPVQAPPPPPAPVQAPTPAPTPAAQAPERISEITPNELYIELEKESQRLVSAANSAQVKLCVMDPIALWARSNSTRSRVAQPKKRYMEILALSDQANLVPRVFERVGYQPNQRFNAANGVRFLNFNEQTRKISVVVLLGAYDMYHRVDLSGIFAQNETVMTETGLALIRLQMVEMADPELDELSALFLEHDLSAGSEKGKIDATQITRLCSDDWGWYRTVSMNLARLQAFASRALAPSEETLVVGRIRRLREGIDSAPKSLRWQTRARLGDSVKWYETPQIPLSIGPRPDMALGGA